MKKSTNPVISKFLFLFLSFIILSNSNVWGNDKIIDKKQSINKTNTTNAGDVIVKEWANDKKSAFSFSFDDAYMSQYTNARPILNQFGFHGTFFILAGSVHDSIPEWRYGLWWQFSEMAQEGHEIAAHTMTHPHLKGLPVGDEQTPNTITYELYQSKKLIEQKIGVPIISFAYPYTEHNAKVDNVTEIYFQDGRAMGNTPNSASLSGNEWYGLTSKEPEFDLPRIAQSDDLDELVEYKSYTQSSIDNGEWTIFQGHEVLPFSQIPDAVSQNFWYPISNEWLTALAQWLKNKSDNNDVWVETIGNVTRYIKERDNFYFNIVSNTSDQITIEVGDGLDDNIYYYPLTTDVVVPNNWGDVAFTQGNVTQALTPFTNNGVNYVRAKINPAGGNVTLQNSTTMFTITSSAGTGGSITPLGQTSVSSGSNQLFTITPSSGYVIASITVDGNPVTVTTPSGQDYTFTNVTANHSINATFSIQQFTITSSASANGSISPSGSILVDNGSNKTFTITPSSGYVIASITVDENPVTVTTPSGQDYTFTNVTANHSISATFSIQQFTITSSASANGTISPSGSILVDNGSNKTFTITPNSGYVIASITVDGNPVTVTTPSGQDYTFTNVTANHSINATFSTQQFTITSSASANGSISPSGSILVDNGSNKTFTITPNSGYVIASITVDGNPVIITTPSGQDYTFTNVTANHTITASFSTNVVSYTFSGKILYNNTSNSPLENVTLKLTSPDTTVEVTTNTAGEFLFNNLLPGTYQISLTTTNTWGGVNATDALKTVRVFANLDTFTDIQKKAADVNNDGSVNSTDALLMVRRFVGLISSFTISDWIYDSPVSITISNQNKTLDIKTLAAGDVDGSLVP